MSDNQSNRAPSDIAISLIESLHKALGAQEITIVALYPSEEEDVYNTSLITSMDDKQELKEMFSQLADEVDYDEDTVDSEDETEKAIQAFKASPGTYEDFLNNMPPNTRKEFDSLNGKDKEEAISVIKMLIAMNDVNKSMIH